MKKVEIFNRVNELIIEEKGTAVTMNSMFTDANLDSLGTMIFFVTLDSEFPIFKDVPEDEIFADLDIPNLAIRKLVQKCRSSIINT